MLLLIDSMRRCTPGVAVLLLVSTFAATRVSAQDVAPETAPAAASSARTSSADYASPGLRIAGIVITAVGMASAAVGGAMLIAGTVASNHCDYSQADDCGMPGKIGGAYTMLASVPLLAVGIPLWVVGSRAQAPGPHVLLGPGSAALRWGF